MAYEPLPIPVSSLATTDVTLTCTMDNGLRIRAGGQNILDRAAPPVWTSGEAPYDPTRWNARGQVFFLELTWEMQSPHLRPPRYAAAVISPWERGHPALAEDEKRHSREACSRP